MRLSYFLFVFLLLLPSGSYASDEPKSSQDDALKALIAQIENAEQRERLLKQLKALAAHQDQGQSTPEDLKGAAAGVVKGVADRMSVLGSAAFSSLIEIKQIPASLKSVWLQFSDPGVRNTWLKGLTNIGLALGAAYIAHFIVLAILRRARKLLKRKREFSIAEKLGISLANFLLDLLPWLAFVLVAHLVLGLVGVSHDEQLVTLAWIYASVMGGLLMTLARLILQPETNDLRLLRINDESAQYGMIWTRRIGHTAIYGYFALQVGLLLNLPDAAYISGLHLLGLLITVMFMVVVAQNRATVSALISGSGAKDDKRVEASLRRRLAPVWHWIAVFYLGLLYIAWSLSAGGSFIWLARATVTSLLIVASGLGLLRALAAGFERGFRISRELNVKYPGLEQRANRYIPIIYGLLRWSVTTIMVLGILQSWGANTVTWLFSDSGRVISGAAIRIGLVLISAFLVWEFGNGLIERYLDDRNHYGLMRMRTARMRTLMTVGRNALRVLVLTVGALMILAQLDVDIRPLLAGAGVFGVAIGFGSQKLVQDVITGAFILFEDTISVGDVVDVGGKAGLVEAISIRNVRLRDASGAVHTIPFSAISTITNTTKDYSNFEFSIGVSDEEDIDRVIAVLEELGEELRKDEAHSPYILEPLEVWGVDSIEKSSITLKGRIKTLPLKNASIGREFNRRMKKRFDELGIRLPYPHLTLRYETGRAESIQSENPGNENQAPDASPS